METQANKRRFRSKAERRQIVEETLKPGASVARVARAHEVNANQVFHWRNHYRAGLLDEAEPTTALVPVTVAKVSKKSDSSRCPPKPMPAGTIEIDLGHARVRIEGADPECVRAALEGLLR